MASVSIEVDESRFNEVKNILAGIRGGAEKAIARALNRAAESAKTALSKGVRERYTIAPSEISKSIKILKASPQNLKATMISNSARMSITKFKTSPKSPPSQKGIPVNSRKKISTEIISGNSKTWKHAFLARMKSGHLGLWSRAGRGLSEIKTASLPQMLGFNPILSEGLEIAQMNLDKELDRQIALILKGG